MRTTRTTTTQEHPLESANSSNSTCGIGPIGKPMKTTLLLKSLNRRSTGLRRSPEKTGYSYGWIASTRMSRGTHPLLSIGCISRVTAGRNSSIPIPGEVAGYLTEAELKCVQALYAGEISLVDKWIGIFLDQLRELGMFDNTLIIFMSDHGEPLGG